MSWKTPTLTEITKEYLAWYAANSIRFESAGATRKR
jgi:hypothetical protein